MADKQPDAGPETVNGSPGIEFQAGKVAWNAYRESVGLKSFNGDPIPTWEDMCCDDTKSSIVRAWNAAGKAVWKLAKLDETRKVLAAGHAGCLGDGRLVDCRIHPEAIPVKR